MKTKNEKLELVLKQIDELKSIVESLSLETEDKKLNYNWQDIKTFEDACKALGYEINYINSYLKELEIILDKFDNFIGVTFLLDINKNLVSLIKLYIIVKAINNGWIPDWNNSNQPKYYPYFQMSGGFRFSDTFYFFGYSYTSGGSRLCLESKEKAEYVGKTFEDLYKDFLS